VQEILRTYKDEILQEVPGASVKFRGSLATGWKGPHKVSKETGAAQRFNPQEFDCDAYIELTDNMWVEELLKPRLLPPTQLWAWLTDIGAWPRTAKLLKIQVEIKQKLKAIRGYKKEAGEPDFKISLQSHAEGVNKLLEGTVYPEGSFKKAGAGDIEKKLPPGRTREDKRSGHRMMDFSEEV
jgi:hypothetical protein